MRAAIYARVSRDDVRERRSVGEQEVACREVVDREGWALAEVFVDNDLSASRYAKKDRPDFAKLLGVLAEGACDVLILWESSRGSRKLSEWATMLDTCHDRGILIHVVDQGRTLDPRRARDMRSLQEDGVDSEYESAKTRVRVLRGVRAKAMEGRPHGRLLYGYQRVYDDRGAFVCQKEHPEQAAVVRGVFAAIDGGDNTASVVKDLNARGIPTGTGRPWALFGVRRMALNPAYLGRRVHQGAVVGDAVWPALVDERLWWRVHRIIADPGRLKHRGSELRHQMSGAVKCGACLGDDPPGEGRVRTFKIPRATDGSRTYVCMDCHRVSCRQSWLDEFIDALVVARLRLPDAERVFSPEVDGEELDRLVEHQRQLQERLDAVYVRVATGELSADGLVKVERVLKPQIAEAEERIRVASTPSTLRIVNRHELASGWADAPVRLRRDVIVQMAEVVMDPVRVRGRRTFDQWRLGRSRWVGDPLTWGERWQAAGLTP